MLMLILCNTQVARVQMVSEDGLELQLISRDQSPLDFVTLYSYTIEFNFVRRVQWQSPGNRFMTVFKILIGLLSYHSPIPVHNKPMQIRMYVH